MLVYYDIQRSKDYLSSSKQLLSSPREPQTDGSTSEFTSIQNLCIIMMLATHKDLEYLVVCGMYIIICMYVCFKQK